MYEELSIERLKIELPMFKSITNFNTIEEAKVYMIEQPPEIHKMFPGIIELIKLLLVRPSSSVSCERGFSKLRTIKTWLRSTMLDSRLNAIVLANIPQETIHTINIDTLMDIFINTNNWRKSIFI